jgi:Tfp pilus assembly protein PilF
MDFGESKNPNLDDLMRLGMSTAKQGNRDNARVIFRQVLDADKRHVGAWLWLASLAENNTDRRRYLETVLRLDPDNETAKKQLAKLDQAVSRSENASLRFGIMIVAVLVIALVLVIGVVLIATKVL